MLSITKGLFIPCSLYLKSFGPDAYINLIGLPFTTKELFTSSTRIVPLNLPCTESLCNKLARLTRSSELVFLTTTALNLK